MLQEKAEQSKRQPLIPSRIKERQDHQTQSEIESGSGVVVSNKLLKVALS